MYTLVQDVQSGEGYVHVQAEGLWEIAAPLLSLAVKLKLTAIFFKVRNKIC